MLLCDAVLILQDDDCLKNDHVKNDIEEFAFDLGFKPSTALFRVKARHCLFSKIMKGQVFSFLAKMGWRAIVSHKTAQAVII